MAAEREEAVAAEREEAVAPEPEPAEAAGDISPARLDAALQRLREEIPPASEGQPPA